MNTQIAEKFKVLSDPNRIEILELLIKGETCGCTLIDKLPITQPTLSYHLKIITNAGLATTKRDGNWIKHFVKRESLDEMIEFLQKLRDLEADECKL
ncbi:MAG TPA: metalloregulator ArsR/SmtB family transcription factor [Bacillota bacterium]|nr:metalloregulator ArsR/SmtB family transcription factor [Bacillota bacterium]